VSYESVRLWCNKFDPLFSKRLKRRHPGFSDTIFMDEVFVSSGGFSDLTAPAPGRS
jgi:transposase-like protein